MKHNFRPLQALRFCHDVPALFGRLCVAGGAVEQPAPQAPATAQTELTEQEEHVGTLVCDQPVYDFGERDNLAKVKHTFQLRNSGNTPITIDRVMTTCGCTAAKLDAKTLAPAETYPLEEAVTLKRRKGTFQKHFYVLSSTCGSQTKTRLTMQGKAIERVRVAPSTLNLGYSGMDAPAEGTVTIQSLAESAKFKITDVRSDSQYVEVSLETSEDGMKHTLLARTKPPLPKGPHPVTIHVTTDNQEYPQFDIPVALRVVDKVEVVPQEVVVYDKGTGQQEPAAIFLNVMPGSVREFAVKGVETPVQSIQAEIIPRPGNRLLVKLSNVPVDRAIEGKEVVILTDIPGMERIAIPIHVRDYPKPGPGIKVPPSGQTR